MKKGFIDLWMLLVIGINIFIHLFLLFVFCNMFYYGGFILYDFNKNIVLMEILTVLFSMFSFILFVKLTIKFLYHRIEV